MVVTLLKQGHVDDSPERSLLRDDADHLQQRCCNVNVRPPHPVRLAFVTNICTHYRVKTFETLAGFYDADFFFYSAGNEWYWQQRHGISRGNFRHVYLPALELTRRIRLVPSLIARLWRERYDIYVKCINGRFALPATYVIARLRGKPFVLWTGIWMSLTTPFHRFVFPMTLWVYRHADAIVVYGEHVKRYLVNLDVAPEKIFVARHAVDNPMYNRAVREEEKAELRTQLKIGRGKIVLYLGRIEAVKGLDYLIKAFALLKSDDSTLVIAGDGSLRHGLETLAREAHVERRVRFAGYVAPETAPAYYAIADLFVLPSITMPWGKELWGLVVNEAMNQGVPVVATEAVGAAAGGLVQPGVNGLIVPERDPVALARAMERILRDDGAREHLSRNAREVVAQWNNERMVEGFRRAISYALERPAKHAK